MLQDGVEEGCSMNNTEIDLSIMAFPKESWKIEQNTNSRKKDKKIKTTRKKKKET